MSTLQCVHFAIVKEIELEIPFAKKFFGPWVQCNFFFQSSFNWILIRRYLILTRDITFIIRIIPLSILASGFHSFCSLWMNAWNQPDSKHYFTRQFEMVNNRTLIFLFFYFYLRFYQLFCGNSKPSRIQREEERDNNKYTFLHLKYKIESFINEN